MSDENGNGNGRELSAKHLRFIDEYLIRLNATQAYIAAGYAEKGARHNASRLITKDNVRAEIKRRMEDAMSSEEVLHRLADHARGDIGDFVDPGTLTVNMAQAKEAGITHLIKKIKQTIVTRDDQQTEIFEFELYDAQKALALLGKKHKLFADRKILENPDGSPITLIRTGMDIEDL